MRPLLPLSGLILLTALPIAGCDDVADPTVDTSIVIPDGGIETTVPVGTDPQVTPAPNPNAGGGGAGPAPTAGSVAGSAAP